MSMLVDGGFCLRESHGPGSFRTEVGKEAGKEVKSALQTPSVMKVLLPGARHSLSVLLLSSPTRILSGFVVIVVAESD